MRLLAIKDEVSPRTHERYEEIVRNFLAPELGALPVSKLAPAHIQNAYAKWATTGRRDGKLGGLSPRTRCHIHRVFNAALVRAVEQQVISRNPAEAFKKRLPKVEKKQMIVLSPEQSRQLLDAIAHTRVYWPAMLALATGTRRGEVFALRWKHVDLERGLVRVVESLEQNQGCGFALQVAKIRSSAGHFAARICYRGASSPQAEAGRGIATLQL
jgi:integrase